MKKLMQFIFVLTLLFLVISCQKVDYISDNIKLKENDFSIKKNTSEDPFEDLIESLERKYNINTQVMNSENFRFIYPNETFVDLIYVDDNTYLIYGGSRIPEVEIMITQKDISTFELDIIRDPNMLMRACDDHPPGEKFNECFKREWDEFCDGLLGCLAQATNPIPVAGAISLHCALC